MIMKRTFIYLALAASVFCACQKENIEPAGSPAAEVPEFYALMEGGEEDTKIHLGEYEGKYRVLWDGYDDLVAMCAGIDASSKYRVKRATANTPAAELYAEKDTDVATEGNAIPDNVAYYPYPNSAKVGDVKVTRNEDGSYTVPGAFSDAQTYLAGSIPSRAFPIVAVSDGVDDNSLNFKNVAGGICFNVKGGAKIKKITFKSNEADKVIAGAADIKVSNTDIETSVPTYEFTGSSKSITLNSTAAVVTGLNEATPFYIGVAPQEFPEGFSVTVEDSDGFGRTYSTSKAREVERSTILNMPPVQFPVKEFDLTSSYSFGNGATYDSETQYFEITGTSNRYMDFNIDPDKIDLSKCKGIGLITDDCNFNISFQFLKKGSYSTASHTWPCGTPGTVTQRYVKKYDFPAEFYDQLETLDAPIWKIRISINGSVIGEGNPKIHLLRFIIY